MGINTTTIPPVSVIDYARVKKAMKTYPKRRNGDEYYPANGAFLVDPSSRELYARDRKGNELYPKSGSFAKDPEGSFYYARDVHGNELYPVQKRKSILLSKGHHARYADGAQRYPTDSNGNEYYLTCGENNEPYLMRKASGETYLAKNKNGQTLIPWNHLHEFISNDPHVCSKDAAGNNVYVNESAFPPALQALIRCLCHISIICPRMVGCNTRLY